MAPRKQKPYDGEQLLHAIAAVRNDSMTVRRAAETYGIPPSTLHDRIKLGLSKEKAGK